MRNSNLKLIVAAKKNPNGLDAINNIRAFIKIGEGKEGSCF